jgi:ParB/RepB/Spo0J family partition protein
MTKKSTTEKKTKPTARHGDDALVVVDGEVITTPTRPALRELVIVAPVLWALSKVRESPFQHRTLYPGLDKLAASLIEDGFLEPLLARQVAGHPDEIELVSGHRRRRAGLVAGYEQGPFVIREMTDEQAIVAVGVHNLQREQPHPLEEALSYEMLAAPALGSSRPARAVAEIAKMFGQDPRHVAQRLKLCALCDEGRELFFNNQLGVQVAFLIARMPHHDRQREVLAKIAEAASHWGGPMSATQVRELIARSMRALSTVAFSLADKMLPRWDGTGDCLSCTRQTGAQAVLFEDIEGKSMCLDAACCTGKTEAHWVAVKCKAIESGERVLTPDEVKVAFPHGHLSYGAEFIDLDAPCHAAVDVDDEDIDSDEPGEPAKAPTYRELIGKQGAPIVMAYLPEAGRIVQLVARQDAVKALTSAGHAEAAKEERREGTNGAAMDPEKRKKDEAKAREAAAIERQVGDVVLVAVLDNLAEKPAQAVMAHLASHVVSTSWSDTQRAVAGRRGLLDKKASDKRSAQELLLEHVTTLRGPALLRLIVEMVYTKAGLITPGYGQKEGALTGLAGLLGIKVASVRAEVKASSKAAAKAKKSAKKAKAPPAAKASAVDEGEEGDDEDEEASDFTVVGRIGAPSAPALEDLGPLADDSDKPTAKRVSRSGGPVVCSSASPDGEHHFSGDRTQRTADVVPQHPAKASGFSAWFVCAHCEAWRVDLPADAEPSGDKSARPSLVAAVARKRADAAAEHVCRICACTEASPCADADGDACSWANVDMTLCTSCAYVLQAFEEQIDDRGAVSSLLGYQPAIKGMPIKEVR